jgi:hypothetical protein
MEFHILLKNISKKERKKMVRLKFRFFIIKHNATPKY